MGTGPRIRVMYHLIRKPEFLFYTKTTLGIWILKIQICYYESIKENLSSVFTKAGYIKAVAVFMRTCEPPEKGSNYVQVLFLLHSACPALKKKTTKSLHTQEDVCESAGRRKQNASVQDVRISAEAKFFFKTKGASRASVDPLMCA